MTRNYYYKGVNVKKPLLNGLSTNLGVVGSLVSPVVFTYAPDPGTYYELTSYQMVLADSGGNLGGWNSFVTRAILPNGLLIERVKDGVIDLSVNIKTNFDMLVYATVNFESKTLGNDVVLTVETTPTTVFNAILDGDKGDLIRVTVRDDLSNFEQAIAVAAGALFIK